MKSLIVRVSVAALALTGFAASSVIAHQSKVSTKPAVVADCSGGPAPLCWPGKGTCGMD